MIVSVKDALTRAWKGLPANLLLAKLVVLVSFLATKSQPRPNTPIKLLIFFFVVAAYFLLSRVFVFRLCAIQVPHNLRIFNSVWRNL